MRTIYEVPPDAILPLDVHVVIKEGPRWRPADDPRVPQLGEAGAGCGVTRRITVIDR